MEDLFRVLSSRQEDDSPSISDFNTAQQRAFGVNGSLIIVIVFVMGVRLYTRFSITKSIGADDFMMIAGTIATILQSVCVMNSVRHGLGRIRAEIPSNEWEPMLLVCLFSESPREFPNINEDSLTVLPCAKSLYISRLFFAVGNVLVKVGLLLFYLRLDNRPKMRWTVYGLMVAVIGLGICHFVMSAIECNPAEVYWTSKGSHEIYAKYCMPAAVQQAFWDAAGVVVIVTDICLWICPIPMIWGLQLPQRQKWAVSAVFALGVVCVAAGCVRFYYVRQLANEPEIYRQFASSLIWYAVELYVAIFCGCSSALKTFFKTFFPALLGFSSCKTKYPLGSNGKEGQGNGTRSSYPLQSLPSRHTEYKATVTSGGRRRGDETSMENVSRNDSEEAIIHGASEGWDTPKGAELQQKIRRASTDSNMK
ncbi:hypothetical protein CMEL01_11036 [Colletotrichum melonis]|uniref:Rhodopsin domain-containing protein n=1 Tax=Colletotrichum melonis TaxID=1209925 RepID=A0AAI9Y0M7_9PEZI|nr:hypothetical protein CMEL01_11036 [Colletotrichum melonis]